MFAVFVDQKPSVKVHICENCFFLCNCKTWPSANTKMQNQRSAKVSPCYSSSIRMYMAS